MKKTVILILAVLPIVLLVIIAFAGQILSIYQHISVEQIEFVDRLNTAYTADKIFTLDQGTTKATSVRVYPELASNKKIIYTSQDESICTVDENGVLTGVHYGSTVIIAKSEDGNKTALLNVTVKADVPVDVTLSKKEISLSEGESYILNASVAAPVAVNKSVIFTSSAPEIVSVSADGKITALSSGEAVITVTTVLGGLTDTCRVVITEGAPAIYFDFDGVDAITKNSSGIYICSVSEINILENLKIREGIDAEKIVIKIQSGSDKATLENGVLTLNENGIVTVRAYIGDEENPDVLSEIKFAFGG